MPRKLFERGVKVDPLPSFKLLDQGTLLFKSRPFGAGWRSLTWTGAPCPVLPTAVGSILNPHDLISAAIAGSWRRLSCRSESAARPFAGNWMTLSFFLPPGEKKMSFSFHHFHNYLSSDISKAKRGRYEQGCGANGRRHTRNARAAGFTKHPSPTPQHNGSAPFCTPRSSQQSPEAKE